MKYKKSFWAYMIERESIRMRRLEGLPREEWTSDWILKAFSFTNVKREHDRTTFLLREEYYDVHDCDHASPEALLNAAIFRYHGTIESARAIGWTKQWTTEAWENVIETDSARQAIGEKIFTPAYIIPSCGDTRPKHYVVAEIVNGIWSESLNILDTNSWKYACDSLKFCWGVGSFMAKEVLLDYILITGWLPNDWDTWTPVGPGGRRGAARIKYGDAIRISETEALDIIRDVYEERDNYWPEDFVELDLTDIQFQCCEFDKYQRAATGEGRPKRFFKPTVDTITGPRNEP